MNCRALTRIFVSENSSYRYLPAEGNGNKRQRQKACCTLSGDRSPFADFHFFFSGGQRRAKAEAKKKKLVASAFSSWRSPHHCDDAHGCAAARRGQSRLGRGAHGLREGHLGVEEGAAGRGREKERGIELKGVERVEGASKQIIFFLPLSTSSSVSS